MAKVSKKTRRKKTKSVQKKTKKVAKKKRTTKKKRTKQPKPDQGIKVLGLVLNVLVLPGLGTLIAGGKTNHGVWQIVLAVVGALLSIILIGIPIVIAAWIWALVDSIKLLQE